MANTIKIKRRPASGAAGKPSSLLNGELAFNENDNILYYGHGSGVGGAASTIEQIGGSGYFAHRSGINASGLWPISVTGNSATVTDGVYTTGTQTINGLKTFNLLQTFNSGISAVAINTSSNSVGYFAVFDSNPNLSTQTLKSVSKDQILDDIGAATSGLDITAGSGLVGGGTLSQNRRFDIGQGDGITVSADAIAIDSTVVRTTGTQTINGSKTFGNQTAFNSGISIGDTLNYLTGTALVINWGDGGDQLASFINNASELNNSINLNAVTTFDNVSYDSLFPFIINPTGYDGYGAVTQGFWRGEIIQVDRGGTGRSTYSNGQLLIGSGTSLAANTLTQGSNVQITNGSGTITIAATGLALSSRTLTAGSGLVGGGDLSSDKTFDIGQGDGISVSANSIAVDSTVVRTTGTQTINGSKTFGNQASFPSGIVTSDISSGGDLNLNSVDLIELNVSNGSTDGAIGIVYDVANKNQQFQLYDVASDNVILAVTDRTSIVCPNTASSGTHFPVFIQNPNAGTSAILSRTASQLKGDIGLSNVTNDAQIKKLASTSGGYVPTWNGTTGDALNIGYSVETTLTGGTGALPRADAVKTYVDNMIVSGIATNDAMIFKGTIDCSTNPNYPAADRGWVYKVSVAGRIGGASGPVVEVNDTIICGTDNTSAGTHASVGSNWNILQTNIVDASILVTGPASATSGNVAMFDGATGKIIKDGGFLISDIARLSENQTFTGTNSFRIINAGYQVNGDPAFTIYNDGDDITFRVMSGGSVTAGTWSASTIAADKGGTGQTSYTNGQLLIGNTTGNTLTKATLTQGSGIAITNGNGSISIAHAATSSLTGAQGSNGIAGITVDGQGHVTAVTTATYLTAGTVCAAIVDCTLDGGSF